MSATPQDVQAKLDRAINEFVEITSIPSKVAARYGNDPTKWPAGHAHNMGDLIAAARAEAGQLRAADTTQVLTADFTYKTNG